MKRFRSNEEVVLRIGNKEYKAFYVQQENDAHTVMFENGNRIMGIPDSEITSKIFSSVIEDGFADDKHELAKQKAKEWQAELNQEAKDRIHNLFTYHPATPEQTEKYNRINAAAEALYSVIEELCPTGFDKMTALLQVRQVRMLANTTIACNGK